MFLFKPLPFDQKERILGIPEMQPSPAGGPGIRAEKKFYITVLGKTL